ncbi:hypothetical protein PHK61_22130 [Actinomycetospora lutea]|uniref:hypothetical protein n=1 Tax=Actinomycetospora lutea TaxID=663604 RepID=UPI0023657FAF|nr:hypothetical protein [Actinomycetospora lutea]MDD7941122.1 hypothetical protein [Actinomycetospora lutea]
MWVWRDEPASGEARSGSGGWRLDAYGTWVWDEPSPLERPGAGIGALRRPESPVAPVARRREVRAGGDRALASLGTAGAEPTPIFHELTEDRSRPRRAYRDRDALAVPEPHPGSGPLPVQDASGRRRGGLAEVPTVPPPALGGSSSPEESPEDELRRRAERRRRPRADEAGAEGGRHAWREEIRGGRHALRR